ncbi:sulfatase-like hydrolase/transferase [Oxalobacteraceae bacterium OTU3CINTB1]|nr:sulfatase-like hydrolase/transferase [Oxalobacteraceae bacterium OTU3CINTB1]
MIKKITRRQAITRTSIALGGALLSGLAPALAAPVGAKSAQRPNILLLIADGWSWQGAEAIDRLGMRMATFARLQREGIGFENAFIESPGAQLPYIDLLENTGYVVVSDNFDAFLGNRPAGKPLLFCLESKTLPRRSKAPVDSANLIVPSYLPDTPAVRGDIAAYRSEIERFDHEAGLLLDRLERAGQLSNILVVMTGKGGWPFPRGAGTLYDAGTHVPLVVMYPGKLDGGRVSKALFSSADLAATVLDVAGAAKPMTTGGQSVVLTSSESYPARAIRTPHYLYIRNLHPERWPAGAPAQQAVTPAQLDSVISSAFAHIVPSATKTSMIVGRGASAMDRLLDLATGKRPSAELYDVRTDPYQLNNLAADPAMKAVLARLDKQLTRHNRET